ncbi:MAG: ATP-binding cassette domain-containing protein [Burkholderiales bacterium]
MALLTLLDGSLAHGDLPLLDRAAFSLESGERIGLIGRNGTGKSSLLSVIAGSQALDDGELRKTVGVRVALVEQEPVLPAAATLRASLEQRASVPLAHKLDEFLHRLGLDESLDPALASGGEQKRAALALAFALQPDLLLLDEPTNHLDIAGIELLEDLLLRQQTAIVVTHDRAFLDRVCTRILELDRGMLRSYPGNFSSYERVKADELASESVQRRKFDKFWAAEEVWIRKGVEARRTRNEGRVLRLERLREERSARRERLGTVKLSLSSGQRSGKLVAELEGVSKSFDDRAVVKDLDLLVSRGDRLGLVGANGAGKSTLLKLILGTLQPDSGKLRLGTNVVPAYFDQMREALDPEKTVAETISPGSDWVELAGGRKHVMSYLGDFLFPPRRANSPVRTLSGGERNRLLLARLFARPANVLVLDEPTNDLDIESLELLEAALQDYDGTLLLVSHDRVFLDNVVTSVLAPEGGGAWKEYAGGYTDWVRQRPSAAVGEKAAAKMAARGKSKAKLSYKEQRELEALPGEIEALEAEQRALREKMSGTEYFRQGAGELKKDRRRAQEIEAQLMQKLEQWEGLEAKAAGSAGC